MEFEFSEGTIRFDKVPSSLDAFVASFCALLHARRIPYVIVSGYVALVFGRSRMTEDVDIIASEIPEAAFSLLWDDVYRAGYECINVTDKASAYREYLRNGSALRFAARGTFIPNMEFKFAKPGPEEYALKNPLTLVLNGAPLAISEFELQIAYKLFLGSEKDIEDARFLFRLFRPHVRINLLKTHLAGLGVGAKRAGGHLGESL